MPRLERFVLAAALLCSPGFSQVAWTQVQPHRAEYTLRLGAAANAPRIGTAVHDLSQDCAGWHLKRDKDDLGGVFSLVWQRFPEGWRIIHDHTSADAPSR